MNRVVIALVALLAGGCASNYQLTLMPRDSGKTYAGTMDGTGGQGRISVTIEGKAYNGTWVEAAPAYTTGWVSGGVGYGYHRGWGGWGGMGSYSIESPGGGTAKALLTAADGSGLRCDFQGTRYSGGGMCRDDAGKTYDVQIRVAEKPPEQR